jgi:DNA repair exonuclease SbcCD ATPase subunit
MLTQAQVRQQAKEQVRKLKRALKKVDTSLEVLERRLDKLLERERLITLEAFDSYLKNYDNFIKNIKDNEVVLINILIIFAGG